MAKDIRVTPELVEARRLALAHNVLPVTHTFVSDLDTPVSAFLKLGAPSRSFLLESAEQGQHLGRYSFLGVGARALVTYAAGRLTVRENGDKLEVEHADPLAAAADLLKSYRPPESARGGLPPLAGGLVGYFGYDLVRRVEHLPDAPPDDLGLPEMAFLLADTVLVFDHLKHTITVVANAFVEGRDVDGPYQRAVERIAEVKDKLRGPLPDDAYPHSRPARPRPVSSSMTRERYEAGVERIRDYIHAGDAFQVVLSQRFSSPVDVSPFSVYRGLRAVNPSPYMYYIAFDDFALCGSSPEPLITVTATTSRRVPSPARDGAAPTPPRTGASSPSCAPTRRSAPSTSCSSTSGATIWAASACPAASPWTSSWAWSCTRTSSTWSRPSPARSRPAPRRWTRCAPRSPQAP